MKTTLTERRYSACVCRDDVPGIRSRHTSVCEWVGKGKGFARFFGFLIRFNDRVSLLHTHEEPPRLRSCHARKEPPHSCGGSECVDNETREALFFGFLIRFNDRVSLLLTVASRRAVWASEELRGLLAGSQAGELDVEGALVSVVAFEVEGGGAGAGF